MNKFNIPALKRKFSIFIVLLCLSAPIYMHSQLGGVGIVLNEYCASNSGTNLDNYGIASDWLEIYNAQSYSVSLNGYWLSNDRNNRFKWQIPSTFKLPPGGYGIVWLSGRNTTSISAGSYTYHANFNLTQCEGQWLILSTNAGVIRDSVRVQKTQFGHTRVRISNAGIGIPFWGVSTINTFSATNPPTASIFADYVVTPTFTFMPQNAATPQFGTLSSPNVSISLGGFDADTTGSCWEVHYTTDGSYPTLTSPLYTSVTPVTISPPSAVLRAVAFMRVPVTGITIPTVCTVNQYLPSFCMTRTFFQDATYQQFKQEFGVLAITTDSNTLQTFSTTGASTPTVHLEYYDSQKQIVDAYGILNKPPQESWSVLQVGYYASIDDRYGYGCSWQGNFFNVAGLGVTSRTVFPTLHIKGGDGEAASPINSVTPLQATAGTGLRDVFMQSLAAVNNLSVSPLHVKPLIVFVNGNYHGVFNLFEVYDKFYESYYYGQAHDSLDLDYVGGTGYVTYPGLTTQLNSTFTPNFYNTYTLGISPILNNQVNYLNLTNGTPTSRYGLDRNSFTDYMILNSFAMNADMWTKNIAYGRGLEAAGPYQNRWHYYLWNTPNTFNFTTPTNSVIPVYGNVPYCAIANNPTLPPFNPTLTATNNHGMILYNLIRTPQGNASYRQYFLNRFQDLLNGPLRCDNLMNHYNYIFNLYSKEMRYHEDPSSSPVAGTFSNVAGVWDTNMVYLSRVLQKRCEYFSMPMNGLAVGCNSLFVSPTGPNQIVVDVQPSGAGNVRLNTVVLPYYAWTGNYLSTTLGFKATPTSTNYVFHHWQIQNGTPIGGSPISLDTMALNFTGPDNVVAVFTDVTKDITQASPNANIPTGFSPNGDGVNDVFMPLGSAEFVSNYDFRVFNRWGQQVFQTNNPLMGWDGNFSGQQSQTGVYAFVITYKNVYGQDKLAKGNVTLIR
ncbi:MAG: gliding motility-associated C-terminal domain-containing protein [Bacteroidetes bacterium]|nr:gliding motility-associated C-terminal domain-containing protein [Bacteroidota bacterium]